MSVARIDASAFRKGLEELGKDIVMTAEDCLTLAVDAAAKDAFSTNLYRNKTWTLRSATRATVNEYALKGRLENRTNYASYVEDGTKPHVIKARRAPILRFYWPRIGAWFAGKSVNHPGTKPRPFMKHAGEVGQSVLESSLAHRTEQLATRFNRAA